jgi:hypothetical protein
MSDHSTTAHTTMPARSETPEAFLADRQRFWDGFTHFTLYAVIFVVLVLVGMATFLL